MIHAEAVSSNVWGTQDGICSESRASIADAAGIGHEPLYSFLHFAALPGEKVVRRCHLIVLVLLEAPHRVVAWKAQSVDLDQYFFVKSIQHGRRLKRRLWDLTVPRMSTHVFDHEALARIRGEKPCYEGLHALTYELWRMIVGCHDLIV